MTDDLHITGGEALARSLAAHGAGPGFGMGGFQLLPFYDAARRLGLEHYLVNDERAGVFMADAWSKLTRRVGLVDATLGPGATNLVTGLVEAYNAGTPMVAIVGNTHRDHSWKNMTQETRQVEILRPAVKELLEATSVARIPELVHRAYAVASSGRPGPVVIDVPEDVSHGEHTFTADQFETCSTHDSVPSLRTRPDAASIEKAAGLLAKATRPVVLVGGGIHLSGAYEELRALVEQLNVPVGYTMTGKGALPCDHPLNLGLFGRYDRIANDLIADSDLVIVIGCKLGEIATKRYTVPPASVTVVQMDVVAEEIGRTRDVQIGIWCDAREGIKDLLSAVSDDAEAIRARNQAYADDIAARKAAWYESVQGRLLSDEVPINMARLMHELTETLPADGIVVADGGFAAHWGGLLFDQKAAGRGFLPDRGFASIGYGLPGAIGASMAAPDRTVVAITGDGGFNMMLGELETARRLGVAPTIVVVNNAASGYVKALQHLMYGSEGYHASDLVETNYAAIAEHMGLRGVRVEDPDDVAAALTDSYASDTLTVLDVVVTRDPAKMLPGVDSRTVTVKKGDRVA